MKAKGSAKKRFVAPFIAGVVAVIVLGLVTLVVEPVTYIYPLSRAWNAIEAWQPGALQFALSRMGIAAVLNLLLAAIFCLVGYIRGASVTALFGMSVHVVAIIAISMTWVSGAFVWSLAEVLHQEPYSSADHAPIASLAIISALVKSTAVLSPVLFWIALLARTLGRAAAVAKTRRSVHRDLEVRNPPPS